MSSKKPQKNTEFDTEFDVVIIGGGLAGLTMACLLGQEGLHVALVDRVSPQDLIKADERTTAISYGSSKILEKAGIWPDLLEHGCPIEDIEILDGGSAVLLQFLSEEVGGKSFGWIIENAKIRQCLHKRLEELKTVRIFAPASVQRIEQAETDHIRVQLEGGETLQARLLIGADGRQSFVRKWMDVETRQWSYNQSAIVCIIEHENPHNNKAIEHFWPGGPFAVLPMRDDMAGQHRSSIVFTEHGAPGKQRPARLGPSLSAMDDDSFLAAMQARLPESYGSIKMRGTRQAYPLNLIHAAHYIGARSVLIADAAHGIHPIAGQGLNLGFRDVGALYDLVKQTQEQGGDIGGQDILEQYQRLRRFDNMSMVAVTDGLVRLFSNNIGPVKTLRRLGLRAVGRLAPAKKFFMKQAMADRD